LSCNLFILDCNYSVSSAVTLRLNATYSWALAIHVSQGSVATHLRCGGVFSYSIIKTFLPILTVRRTKIVPNSGPPCIRLIFINCGLNWWRRMKIFTAQCSIEFISFSRNFRFQMQA